jgi:hypothetical protein
VDPGRACSWDAARAYFTQYTVDCNATRCMMFCALDGGTAFRNDFRNGFRRKSLRNPTELGFRNPRG